MQEAIEQLKEATAILNVRRTLREANLSPVRPNEEVLKKLDSSMKRNTGLIRKLKQLGEDSSKSILDDIAKTNQSKYVSEAVVAVAEAPLKLRDISAAVKICSALHQRYAEFSNELGPALARNFAALSKDGEEKPSLARKRALLRLFIELLLAGVFPTHTSLLSIVRQIASSGVSDLTRNREEAIACISLMTVFAKVGREEILGLPHADPAALPADLSSRAAAGDAEAIQCAEAAEEYNTELSQRYTLPPEAQVLFKGAAGKFLDAVVAVLQSSHEALVQREKDNERVLNTRGDLPESLAAKYEAQRTAFETLERGAAGLGETLDRQLPAFQIAPPQPDLSFDGGAESGHVISGEGGSQSPFEDEESRVFYESLPNLREVVPAVLLKGAAEPGPVVEKKEEVVDGGGEGIVEEVQIMLEESKEESDAAEKEGEAAAELETAMADLQLGNEDVDIVEDEEEVGEESNSAALPAAEESGSGRGSLEAILEHLPHCVSKELCDELAVEFFYAGGASKNARKRLASALCHVPTGALQLLPYYARIAAVLAPLFPDVPAAVIKFLQGECRGLSRKKDATTRTLEPRLRNARYIAELVKFRIFPVGTAFLLLKALLDDFFGHNVDAACSLVETAGRYLLRRPDTAVRMTNMLEIMMKLKNAKNLDVRLAQLVDSTYFAVKATAQGPKIRIRPPTHQWIRYLIYSRLEASSVPYVLKKLRRVKWSEDGEYVMRTLLRAARKGRFSQLPPLASLTAGLTKWHPALGVGFVDTVLEEITAGMENPEAALYQRRVAYVRLLGELYAYKLANSTLIFNTLHSLLAYGHTADVAPEITRRIDAPQNFFRVRLVCALLESCGTFFSRGAAKKRLDNFLPYLQRYILSKPPLPLDVDLDIQELYSRLNITPPKYDSYDAACTAVAELETKAAAAAASGLEIIEEEEEEEEEGPSDEDEEDGEERFGAESDGEGEDIGSGTSDDGTADESDSDDEDEDSNDGEDDDEEEDEEMAREKTEAEEEFERELAAAMGDSGSSSREGTVGKVGGGYLPVAGGISPIGVGGLLARPGAPSGPAPAASQPSETMALRVMMKRGARADRTQELLIPVPVSAARQLREKEAAEAAERAEMKRMVLASNRRDELEAAQAAAAVAGAGASRGPRWQGGHFSAGGGSRNGPPRK